MSHNLTLRIGVTLLLSANCFVLGAQQQIRKRPKIGVAFEGGGALGLGHIGVLEWLEANHIPVDYVAGTSMGGLVGGLYASGKDTKEIRSLIRAIDWDDVLRGQIEYKDLAFRRKQDSRAYPNYIEFGLKNGLSLPGGINSGQQVKYILDRAALPYSNIKSFDELPIPFRCVATEMVSGKAYVFKDGSLSEALRATMSLPAIFAPVQTPDGKLFTDGGLMNNLPVDVVKAMGADIIIAIYLAVEPFDPKKSTSLFTMLGQSITVMIAANERRNMEMADVLVTVDLAGYSALDYKAGDKIADKGVEGAEKKRLMLTNLSVDEQTWQDYIADRKKRTITTVPAPQFVSVTGSTPELNSSLEESLNGFVGKELKTADLEHKLTQITGQGRFSTLSYQLTEKDGKPGLRIGANEKTYAPPIIKPGVFIDGSDIANVRFGIGARITAMDLGGFRSELRTDFIVGSKYAVNSEYFRPFSAHSNWFWAPSINAGVGPLDVYQDNKRVAEYKAWQTGGALDIGYLFGRSSEMRLGYSTGYRALDIRIGSPSLPTFSGRYGATTLAFTHDGWDSALIPRSGLGVTSAIQYVDASPGSPKAFTSAQFDTSYFKPISKPASVFVTVGGGTTFGNYNTGIPQFFLGGPLRIGAYGVNEIRTNQFGIARLGYLRELGGLNPLIGDKIYWLAFLEAAKITRSPQGLNWATDANTGIVVNTFLGPIFMGGAYGNRGHTAVYFKLGRIF